MFFLKHFAQKLHFKKNLNEIIDLTLWKHRHLQDLELVFLKSRSRLGKSFTSVACGQDMQVMRCMTKFLGIA